MLRRRMRTLVFLMALGLSAGCGAHLAKSAHPGDTQEGDAVWYGKEQHGGPTASGERFNMHELTAAHRTLRMGTLVQVTNLRSGLSVVVRINDRGPYTRGRIIDLSYAAAKQLGMVQAGVAPVLVRVLRVP